MRGWAIVGVAVLATGCGRRGFDAVSDASGDDAPDDGALADAAMVVLPQTELYVKASNTGAGDFFGGGVSLSADGKLLAIGAYAESSGATGVGGNQADNSRPGSGAVYLFTRGATTWTQSAYIKASNTDVNDEFGFTVALSGDGHTLAVDAPLEASVSTGINGIQTDNTVQASGAIYVFSDSGGAWTQQAYIKASNTDNSDQFGWALAISNDGNTLVAGARKEDSAAAGIGANQLDDTAVDAGAVYVFTRAGTTWSQQAYIKPTTVDGGEEFGRSVAVSDDGNVLVVAATYERSNATGINGNEMNTLASAAGAAWVFTRTGGVWSQETYLKASNTNPGDQFGVNVSISGNGKTIAVAASKEASAATGVDANQLDNTAAGAGAVYLFVRDNATWMQEAYIKAPNTDPNDEFGWATALTRDGNELVISATGEASASTGIDGVQTNNAATSAGAAYIYTRSAGQWTFASYLKATNSAANDEFGTSIAIAAAAGTIIVGAYIEDSAATGINGDGTNNGASASGAAYIFE